MSVLADKSKMKYLKDVSQTVLLSEDSYPRNDPMGTPGVKYTTTFRYESIEYPIV